MDVNDAKKKTHAAIFAPPSFIIQHSFEEMFATGATVLLAKAGAIIRPRWEQRPPEERAADIQRTPLRRMGEAVDQANVICFLASSHADFVTGLTIDVTGGL